jgi:hypothetical protein
MAYGLKRRLALPLSILMIAVLGIAAMPGIAGAQGEESRTFPETGYTVNGRFLDYWQTNGGLSVFGYPLSAERTEEGRLVQYFERTRFEYVPENERPYDVLLGRIGAQILNQQGTDWQQLPTGDGPADGCVWFPETQHNVCNQLGAESIGFLNYWQTHGLSFDNQAGFSYSESLALFGMPISEAYTTTVEGKEVQVQWFERARFEWHPDNPAGYRVLLGRLGAQLTDTGAPSGTVDEVSLYFVAIGDEGDSGREIGCGDSLVPVTINIEPTETPLSAAMYRLVNIETENYGQSGLYNALYRSNLSFDNAVIENNRATVYLSGNVAIGGTCDAPRFKEQLRGTALQFNTVDEVDIYINDRPMDDVLAGGG